VIVSAVLRAVDNLFCNVIFYAELTTRIPAPASVHVRVLESPRNCVDVKCVYSALKTAIEIPVKVGAFVVISCKGLFTRRLSSHQNRKRNDINIFSFMNVAQKITINCFYYAALFS